MAEATILRIGEDKASSRQRQANAVHRITVDPTTDNVPVIVAQTNFSDLDSRYICAAGALYRRVVIEPIVAAILMAGGTANRP